MIGHPLLINSVINGETNPLGLVENLFLTE